MTFELAARDGAEPFAPRQQPFIGWAAEMWIVLKPQPRPESRLWMEAIGASDIVEGPRFRS